MTNQNPYPYFSPEDGRQRAPEGPIENKVKLAKSDKIYSDKLGRRERRVEGDPESFWKSDGFYSFLGTKRNSPHACGVYVPGYVGGAA